MNFSLQKITGEDLLQFKRDMQEAFQCYSTNSCIKTTNSLDETTIDRFKRYLHNGIIQLQSCSV